MRLRCAGSNALSPGLILAGLVLAFSGAPAAAQTPDSGVDDGLNFAFATQLGSGIYNVSGRTVQIYRLPFSFILSKPEARSPGVRIELPVCFGFYDFDAADVEQTGKDDNLATVTLVPGVAVGFKALPNWLIEPFVELGIAEELNGPGSAYVYVLGVRSFATFGGGKLSYLLGNRLVYSGEHTPGVEVDEDFAMLESGFEVRSPLRHAVKGHAIDWGPYVMNYLYLEPTEVLLEDAPVELGSQYEFGITIGTQKPVPLWCFEFPRLGLGYRFGDGVSAFRVVFGAAF